MNYIVNLTKGALEVMSSTLNQPVVKQNVKDAIGGVNLIFGLLAAYDLCRNLAVDRNFSTDQYVNTVPRWFQIADKAAIIFAKLGAVLTAIVSRPGMFVTTSLGSLLLTAKQINAVFGNYAVFEANPTHPYHLASLGAFWLCIPLLATSLIKTVKDYKVIQEQGSFLSDSTVRKIVFFVSLFSRAALHRGNQGVSLLLKKLT